MGEEQWSCFFLSIFIEAPLIAGGSVWRNFLGGKWHPLTVADFFNFFTLMNRFFTNAYDWGACIMLQKSQFCLDLPIPEKSWNPWCPHDLRNPHRLLAEKNKSSKKCQICRATGKHIHCVVLSLSKAIRGGSPENRTLLLWFSWKSKHLLSILTQQGVFFRFLL